jgi:hypothetical protein
MQQSKNADWSKNEIQRVAASSGKPLEISCAEAFLAAGWKARLGSYFTDGALDVFRELDVLAEKERLLEPGIPVRVRVLLSCRGFPSERSPLVYSVSESSVPSVSPGLLSGHRSQQQWNHVEQNYGPLDYLEGPAALHLLKAANLTSSRSVVAFDMIERTEIVPRKGPDKNRALVTYSRARDGDRLLFGAVDSAVRAASYWTREDYQRQRPVHFAALNVPVCVLSVPFWDICVDGGKLSQPEIGHRAYQSIAYPARPFSKEVMALIWSVEQLKELVSALDELVEWFFNETVAISKPA